ncbi:phospholipase A2, partial [Kitasatospora sp. NPDC047058]|uniref:phospholipase A2 n=1 Tax=Kitasatospora sp. NPDC047058 TaxID=3155620 RepID=UPI0033D9ADA7
MKPDAGAPVSPAPRAEKIAALDRMVQTGQDATDAYLNAYATNRKGTPDRYEFNWSTNVCNSPAPNMPFRFDFSNACIRHDFGYRNYRELLGEGGFRFKGLSGLEPSPKDRVDKVFLQDMDAVCDAFARTRHDLRRRSHPRHPAHRTTRRRHPR